MWKKADRLIENLENSFYWFWVKGFRVSYLVIFTIILVWLYSLYAIPKESAPDIKFWVIVVSTLYQWVSPDDIDNLITDKIEKEIKDIDGIKKITSNSMMWMSSVTVELYNDIDVSKALNDIQEKVNNVDLPTDAEKPVVTEIATRSDVIFEVALYGDKNNFSYFDIMQNAQKLKNDLEGKWWISKINIWWSDDFRWNTAWWWWNDYEIKVLLDKVKLEVLWLSVSQIASIIRDFNKNQPIWNFLIWDLWYDFRFDWELDNIEQLKQIPLIASDWSVVKINDIAKIEKEYRWDNIAMIWFYNSTGFNYVNLTFEKVAWTNVFNVSDSAKKLIEDELKKKNFEWLSHKYIRDLSEIIRDDYRMLGETWVITIVVVFLSLLTFIWFKESFIWIIMLPLAFLVTFMILHFSWKTLNFLTNFSLVLSFWIAIDTIIVIVQWASVRLNEWYSSKNAILIAINDFKAPLISSTLTTLVVFLPMMFLPDILGKFLAYIPITLFITLSASLFLSLSVIWAVFSRLIKSKKAFEHNPEQVIPEDEMELLELDRKWKKELNQSELSFREKRLLWFSEAYYKILWYLILKRSIRIIVILFPIFVLILTFIFLSSHIWFTIFPESDEGIMTLSVTARSWIDSKHMEQFIWTIENSVSKYPELKLYTLDVKSNKIVGYIELLNKNERKKNWMKNVFEIEKLISPEILKLEELGLKVDVWVLKWWPPGVKPVGIKLVADTNKKLNSLKQVSKDFEKSFKDFSWTKNVTNSSNNNPWQFVFRFDRQKLRSLWILPSDILGEIYFMTNWVKASSIKSDYEDNDIVVKVEQFDEYINPVDIENLVINTKIGKIKIKDIANYEFDESISAINRENSKIIISVESDVEDGYFPTDIQPKLVEFANQYDFPEWISYEVWWETQENMDLLIATWVSFILSLILIFAILVFQFNSFSKPMIILYSVVQAMIWVNIWLYILWLPYSMPFAIWFISLTWIVVNNAIVLIDKINKNIERNFDKKIALLDASRSRIHPILVTTISTLLWIYPLVLQDEFWAWLWYTIIFGLVMGTLMTLLIVPVIYYEFFISDNKFFWKFKYIFMILFFPVKIIIWLMNRE